MGLAPVTQLPISQVATCIARGDLSPVEVTTACLEAVDLLEPSVHAFCRLDADDALRQARLLSDELAHGHARSPLHGIPVAIKDIIDVAGTPTVAGSALLAQASPAQSDAAVVRCLRRAGAVVFGKTRTPEFAVGGVTPTTRNPRDLSRIAGGSSGGSAAAVAAGECFAALGTDTGGSIRIPAALCGVAGLMPRKTAVCTDGVIPVSPMLDSCGPMARTAADVALLWDVLSPGQEPVTGCLRLGYVGPEFLGDLPAEIRDAVQSAVTRLAAAGQAVPVEVHPPPFANWHPHRRVPLLIDALAVHRRAGWYPDSRAQYGTRMRAFLDHATQLTVADVADALRHITALSERLMDCFLRCDVLVLPATPMTAPRFDDLTDRGESSQPPIDHLLTRLCAPINFCPLAAVAMPCGTSVEGLPIGLQFIARDEATALNCARRLEM